MMIKLTAATGNTNPMGAAVFVDSSQEVFSGLGSVWGVIGEDIGLISD